MASVLRERSQQGHLTIVEDERVARIEIRRETQQAYQILRFGFAAAPIIAGFDKFVNYLANWDQYLAPWLARLIPFNVPTFMQVIGGIEVLAGILVALKPRIGAYIVSAWLMGIVINLLTFPGFYDIALRDFGLALGALALGRLSEVFDSH